MVIFSVFPNRLRAKGRKNVTEKIALLRRGGKKGPRPSSFSPVTFTKVGISLQNFLAFSVNLFATLVLNFKGIPGVSPKLLNLNREGPSKSCIFWSNPYKIELR